ncbi:CHAT domain-containing protein [Brevibacterium metallidurans]|uniref:CHAT domain-containing protein n=1 Tax=Brevibacterium metallidurans TaxID=1482676 RepID=A0ABP3CEI8_9MICO
MARTETLRREIASLDNKIGTLKKDLGKQMDAATRASTAASRKQSEASRTTSNSTRRMAESAAEREAKKAALATKKEGEIRAKIADAERSLSQKHSSLASAERDEQRARDREAASRAAKERSAQQARDRETKKRQSQEKAHAREVARLSQLPPQIRYVTVQPPSPERLRVLYLTANPHAVETTLEHPDGTSETSGTWLRVDREVRAVRQELKASRWRDLVEVEHLPAATSQDLTSGLNYYRPHVVHFSGHASSLGLLFENEEGSQDGSDVTFDLLARILDATDEPPRLVVLNACESFAGAESLLRTVPTAIGMSASITDLAAITFAAKFYAAIASAQSVATAIEQAKIAMLNASLVSDSKLPQVLARDDVELASLKLVKPSQ